MGNPAEKTTHVRAALLVTLRLHSTKFFLVGSFLAADRSSWPCGEKNQETGVENLWKNQGNTCRHSTAMQLNGRTLKDQISVKKFSQLNRSGWGG